MISTLQKANFVKRVGISKNNYKITRFWHLFRITVGRETKTNV